MPAFYYSIGARYYKCERFPITMEVSCMKTGGNCMGVDSILGYNLSVQTKDFTKRITSGATGDNQTQGLSES